MILLLKIRRAEVAMADGRLDEAFDLAQDPQVRDHRRGQRLVTKLAGRYVQRGHTHLEAGRVAEALADCSMAEKLAGRTHEVAELRAAADEAWKQAEQHQLSRQNKVAAVRQELAAGRVSVAERLITEGETPADAQLHRELDRRREVAGREMQRAEAALADGDAAAAMDHLVMAARHAGQNENIRRLQRQAVDTIVSEAAEAVESGRLDRAEYLLRRATAGQAANVAGEEPKLQELLQAVRQCRAVARQFGRGEAQSAVTALNRLQVLLPNAKWVREASEQARQAAEAIEAVRQGPIGLLAPSWQGSGSVSPDRPTLPIGANGGRRSERPRPEAPSPAGGDELPPVFAMQVDGVGGFIVATEAKVSLGPLSSSRQHDVGLVLDPALPTIDLVRVDEDYFVEATEPVVVDGRPTTRALLRDGARIELSPRCRLRFVRPNAASTTAMLMLSRRAAVGGRPIDAQALVLLDRELIFGPARNAHIVVDDLVEQVVLRRHGRQLAHANGGGAGHALPLNRPVHVGAVSMVLTPMNRV